MIRKSVDILKEKQNLFVVVLFIFFFPLKTQLQNVLMYLFDIALRGGVTSQIFSYNYKGTLIGCEQILQMNEMDLNFSWFQRHGIYYLQFFPSLIAFFLLYGRYRKKVTFGKIDWFLVLIACFSIYESLIEFQFLSLNFRALSTSQLIRLSPILLLFILMGFFIFFKIFSFKERIRTVFYGFLGFILSAYLWFSLLGPKILPIVT